MKSHVLTKVEYIHIHITASSYTSQHERTFPLHTDRWNNTARLMLSLSLTPCSLPTVPSRALPPAWFAYKHHKPVLQPGWPATPDPDSFQSLPHHTAQEICRREDRANGTPASLKPHCWRFVALRWALALCLRSKSVKFSIFFRLQSPRDEVCL